MCIDCVRARPQRSYIIKFDSEKSINNVYYYDLSVHSIASPVSGKKVQGQNIITFD